MPVVRKLANRSLGPCPVCGREMQSGPSVNRHRWVPKAKAGRESRDVHVVCRRMLHRVFTEAVLAAGYAAPDTVRDHPEIARFIAWVRRKPVDYVDWPKAPRGNDPRRPRRRKR